MQVFINNNARFCHQSKDDLEKSSSDESDSESDDEKDDQSNE